MTLDSPRHSMLIGCLPSHASRELGGKRTRDWKQPWMWYNKGQRTLCGHTRVPEGILDRESYTLYYQLGVDRSDGGKVV